MKKIFSRKKVVIALALIAILIPAAVASVLLSNTLTGSFNAMNASVVLSWGGASPNDDVTLIVPGSYNYNLRIANPGDNSISHVRVVLHVTMVSNCPDGAFKVFCEGSPISWALKSGAPNAPGNGGNDYTYYLLNDMTVPAQYNDVFQIRIQLTADAPLCQYTYSVYAEMVHQ